MVIHLVFAGVTEHHGIVKKLAAVAVGKGGDTQQRRLLRQIHRQRQLFVRQHRRQAFIVAADGDAALFLNIIKFRPLQMHQRQRAKQFDRHIAVFQHQRLAVHIAYPAREVDPLVNLNSELAGDSGWGGHHFKHQHLADHLFTLLAQHFRQPGQVSGFVMNIFVRHVGAAAVLSDHQPPFNQQIDGFTDGHARHPKLLCQRFLTG